MADYKVIPVPNSISSEKYELQLLEQLIQKIRIFKYSDFNQEEFGFLNKDPEGAQDNDNQIAQNNGIFTFGEQSA